MLLQTKKVRRGQKWRRLFWMFILAGFGFFAWKGGEALLPRYRAWKQQRSLAQARTFIEKQDPQNAKLALDAALAALPGNTDATRVAAELLEQVGAPQSLRLRRQVLQMQPDSTEDAAALIYAALKFRDFNTAKETLSGLKPEIAAQPAALKAAYAYALATDNRPIADAIADQLAKLYPDDEQLQLSHASLLLRHPREERRAEARQKLEAIATKQPKFALAIHRELANEAIQHGNYANARHFLQQAIADTGASLNEHMQLANLDLLVDKKPFAEVFAQLATRASGNVDSARQFINWLLVQRKGDEAARWFNTLPAELRSQPGMNSSEADIAAALADWNRLLDLIAKGAWGGATPETMQLVAAARAIDTQQRPALRRDTWELAINSTQGNLAPLRVLHRLAAIWQWEAEAETCLLTVTRNYPDQPWAHQTLFNVYHANKNTTGLRNVMSILREANPAVPRFQHDWAVLSLLLEPTSSWNNPKEIIENLYKSNPSNSAYGVSYAFALAQSNRGPEALAVLQKIEPAELKLLNRLPYVACVYGVARQKTELDQVIAAAANATYLPEESSLLTRAQVDVLRKPEVKKTPSNSASTYPTKTSLP